MAKKRKSVVASLLGAIGPTKGLEDNRENRPAPTAPGTSSPIIPTPGLPPDVEAASQPPSTRLKDGLTWREFEMMVGDLFRHQGYSVTDTGHGADGGVDLELRHGDQLYLVQCKHWNRDVGVKPARELAGVVALSDAEGGFLVTSGRFTEIAKQEFSGQDKIFLVDGHILKNMAAEAANRPDLAPPPLRAQPACPRCSSVMVDRTARRGVNVGSRFWGCSTYPKCRGTRDIESTQPRPAPLLEVAGSRS